MASLIARLWTKLYTKKAPLSVMIVGLDNSGKTSILNHLSSLNHHQHHSGGGSRSPASSCQQQATSVGADRSAPTAATTASTASRDAPSDGLSSGGSATKNLERGLSSGLHYQGGGGGGGNANIMPTVGYNYERIQYKNLTITVLDFSGQNRYRNLWQEFYNGVDAIVFVLDSSDLIRFVVVRDELETMLSHPYFATLTEPYQPRAAVAAQKQITVNQGKLIQTTLVDHTTTSPPSSAATPSTIGSSLMRRTPQTTTSTSKRRTKVPILFLANKTDLPNSVDTEVITKALNLNQLPIDRHPWFIQATSVNLNQGIVEGFDWLVGQLSVVD